MRPGRGLGGLFQRLLVPVNFTQPSRQAVELALDARRRLGATVCLFNLTRSDETEQFLGGLGSPTTPRDLVAGARQALRRFVDTLDPTEADGLEYDAHVADDYVGAVRDKVTRWEPTLVVLAHEARASLLRTHTEKILLGVRVPVLVLQSAREWRPKPRA